MQRKQRKQLPDSTESKGSPEARVSQMGANESAAHFLARAKGSAATCRMCPIGASATQTVFGEGPANSHVVLVGEQPGNDEDLKGKVFVGPAGQVLNRALAELGVPRETVYLTNAVKHFKWIPRGKIRLHQKPTSREMGVCKSWLLAELEAIKPRMIICLGATAAQSVLGHPVKIYEARRRPHESPLAPFVFVTTHPSAVLRAPDSDAVYEEMVDDLREYFGVLSGERAVRMS